MTDGRQRERVGKRGEFLRGCDWMIFNNVFTLLWHFSFSNQETVIETAPEVKDRKRKCDKLAGNPALTIKEGLIPALKSMQRQNSSACSLANLLPDYFPVSFMDQTKVQQVIKQKTENYLSVSI